MYWVYKCNSKDREYQRTYGDWAEVFESQGPQWWGTTKIVPELSKASAGDTILAYQTDRNELVGVARVVGWKPQGKYKRLILKPVRTIGVRVRPLKEASSKIARIPALQPGQIRTLYSISRADATALLKAAGVHLALAADVSESGAEQAAKGDDQNVNQFMVTTTLDTRVGQLLQMFDQAESVMLLHPVSCTHCIYKVHTFL
jgi:hypothetical protein